MTDRKGLGLYVHWPFCQAKCPYCDFNSHVVPTVDQGEWRKAFQAEIARVSDLFPDRTLDTIYFGGGTPSLMDPETVEAILASAQSAWRFSNQIEITLEANPTSVEADRFKSYAALGVNRVSIGVQALNDVDLKTLGRLHSAKEAIRAVELGKQVFPRVSFDLIYARQHQSTSDWEKELAQALAMADGHLSLYQLTIEPGTAFGDRFASGRLHGLPDEIVSTEMFELTQYMTADAGLPAYEVSNHARPGHESQHNLIYWRGHDWIGVGPGAHGRYTRNGRRQATEAYPMPTDWLSRVGKGSGDRHVETLSPEEADEERLMMGLRLTEGVSDSKFQKYRNKINILCDSGQLKMINGRVSTTDSGRLLLNAVLREILT